MSNYVFNFNILPLVLSGILGWSQIYITEPCAPRRPPSGKILTCAQVLAYSYIISNFQLRSSIHAGLTESSLYNRFALKNLPKWGFRGIFREGLRYLVGTPLGIHFEDPFYAPNILLFINNFWPISLSINKVTLHTYLTQYYEYSLF